MKATLVGVSRLEAGAPARLRATLARIGAETAMGHCSLSVMLTDDAGIADYSRRFRGKDEPTDVLSFASEAGDATARGHYLGDLVVSTERAAAQAREHGHGLEQEVEVLILHGVLHLLGHDHETDSGEMARLEQAIAMRLWGSTRGLIDRTEGGGE